MITLRDAMRSREGDADFQIGRGRRAWAVERRDVTHTGELGRRQTAIVFGTCRSDALRRAQYGGRLGESHYGTEWRIAEITTGWDAPVVWPEEIQRASDEGHDDPCTSMEPGMCAEHGDASREEDAHARNDD